MVGCVIAGEQASNQINPIFSCYECVLRTAARVLSFERYFLPIEGRLGLIERDGIEVMEGACENLIPAIEIHSKVGGALPVPKDASSTVASDGDILANDLALLPFVVGREYFGYADLGRTLFP